MTASRTRANRDGERIRRDINRDGGRDRDKQDGETGRQGHGQDERGAVVSSTLFANYSVSFHHDHVSDGGVRKNDSRPLTPKRDRFAGSAQTQTVR